MPVKTLRKIQFANAFLATFLPLALVLLFGWFWLVPLINRGVSDQQHQLAETIAGQVELFLSVPESHIATIASLHPDDLNPENRRHVQHVIDTAVKMVPHLRSVYLVGANGRIEAVGITDDLKQVRQDLLGLDMTGNDLYRRARATKSPQWSETFLSVVGSGLSVAVALPSGPRVLIGEIDLAVLSTFLAKDIGVKRSVNCM